MTATPWPSAALAPEFPLPARAWLPGHPERPSQQLPFSGPEADEPWWSCATLRHALDLWRHGFAWEAHEPLEFLWKGAVETGDAQALQALIAACAASVTGRLGRETAARSHRAKALSRLAMAPDEALDLDLRALTRAVARWDPAAHPALPEVQPASSWGH